MARKMTEWPSKRGPITKIMPSDGCIGDTVPLAVGKWCDFHEFGWYMGNVGLISTLRSTTPFTSNVIYSTDPRSNDFGLTSSMCGIARARQPERTSL